MRTRFLVLVMAGFLIVQPAPTSAQARFEKNVIVGMYSGLALVMDVHYPEDPNGYGIVHVAGSGWARPLGYDAQPISERHVDIWGQPLVEQGYTVFSLNHRAIPRFQYPGPVDDVQRAVRFIRFHAEDYGIDPERVGAVGGSSGGYMVSMLGMLDGEGNPEDADPVNRVSAKVQAVVGRAVPSDLSRSTGGAVATLLGSDLGRDFDPDADQMDEGLAEELRKHVEASPITYVSSDDPPTLLIHGDADGTVPFDQSQRFLEALRVAGVTSRLLPIPGGGHGPTFRGSENPPDYIGAMIDWFDTHLKR
jgi:acetyl esterase/lipase